MAILRIALFIFIVILILGPAHYYVWRRLVRDVQMPPKWRRAATIAILIFGLSLPGLLLIRILPPSLSRYLLYIPFTWMGFFFFTIIILFALEVIRFFSKLLEKFASSDPPNFARRVAMKRLAGGMAAAVAFGNGSTAIALARRDPILKELDIRLSLLPSEFDGYTIVQITDLHIGLTLTREFVEEVVDGVLKLKPDAIAITGDIVDGSPDRLRDDIEPLSRLRAKDGIFFVTGNHEYYSDMDLWFPKFQELGFTVLRNEGLKINRSGKTITLAGVEDHSALQLGQPGPDVAAALSDRAAGEEAILLAHQPRIVDDAASHDVGLVLSGHTHGGQIWPWGYVLHINQPYISGLHRHGNRTQIYVSEGTGYWGPPMRLGTRSEITLIRLFSKTVVVRS